MQGHVTIDGIEIDRRLLARDCDWELMGDYLDSDKPLLPLIRARAAARLLYDDPYDPCDTDLIHGDGSPPPSGVLNAKR